MKKGTKEERIIYAEDGKDFQEYVDKNGNRIKAKTPVGYEYLYRKEWKIKLFKGIFYPFRMP